MNRANLGSYANTMANEHTYQFSPEVLGAHSDMMALPTGRLHDEYERMFNETYDEINRLYDRNKVIKSQEEHNRPWLEIEDLLELSGQGLTTVVRVKAERTQRLGELTSGRLLVQPISSLSAVHSELFDLELLGSLDEDSCTLEDESDSSFPPKKLSDALGLADIKKFGGWQKADKPLRRSVLFLLEFRETLAN